MLTPSIKVDKSKIHGTGCYATTAIPRGQIVTEYVGELIDYAEAVRRNDKTHRNYSEYILEVKKNLFIDAARFENQARYINHSCEPNCIIKTIKNRAFIVSIRPIAPGEELTYDYMYDIECREPCFCGAPACRGYM